MKLFNSKIICILAVPALLCSSCGGSGSGSKIVDDENTINIKLHLGGYKYAWMEKLIEKFESAYADQGYKVNLLTPGDNGGSNVINEFISGYKSTKVDIYFAANIYPSKLYSDTTNTMMCEALDELVYDQKAIKFDGTEEEKTVREKLDSSFGDEWYKYNGKSYNFFYQKSVGSLAVNREKLASFGYELPVTTNEFTTAIEGITKKNINGDTKVRPIVVVGGTSGYPTVMMNSWFTQYSGIEKWDEFWSMNNVDGSYNTESGYKVFEDEGLHKAAELVYRVFDQSNIVRGSRDYDINAAHTSLMKENNGGVFMFDGDWLLNETSLNYSEKELEKLSFINVPVTSALGTKLWGNLIKDEKACDSVLSKVVRLSDAGKTVAETKTQVKSDLGYDLSEESITAVYKARGIYNNRGVLTGTTYIPTGLSDAHKDIASKFLRMFASDDFSKEYFSISKCVSPYSKSTDFDTSSMLEFSKGHAAIVTHQNAVGIWPMTKGLRNKISGLDTMFPVCKNNLHDYAMLSEETAYDEDGNYEEGSKAYWNASESQLSTEYKYVTDNWSKWVANIK